MWYDYLRLVFIRIICIWTIFFSLCSFRPQISIIFSTTIPPYPLTPVLVITNIVVSYELPVIARLLSFQFFSFTIWRCGGSGRYSPPYTDRSRRKANREIDEE